MSKFLKVSIWAVPLLAVPVAAQEMPPAFQICGACHAVGDGAKHKIGPHLNDVFGRAAGGLDDYAYSPAMAKKGSEGLAWDTETLSAYLNSPLEYVPGTKMGYPGVGSEDDLKAILGYLASFSGGGSAADASADGDAPVEVAGAPAAIQSNTREGGVFGLGREATADEVAAWNIDVRPDGQGLPVGSGNVFDGDDLFQAQCAVCHGVFGEGSGRWPVLAGGQDTLTDERPEKTIGSYWPYLSTTFDYIRRAMPYGNAHSLTADETYALTAYLLYMNDLVDDDFELSNENFTDVVLPNQDNFIEDDRASEPHYAKTAEPCMTDCKPGAPEIVMRARILDVTPGSTDDDGAGVGAVE